MIFCICLNSNFAVVLKELMNTKDLDHVARLARLGVSDTEKKKLVKELTVVFSYIEQLQKFDTKNVMPTAHVGGLHNVSRSDEAVSTSKALRDELRAQFPDHSNSSLRVPPVFNRE